MKTLEIKNFNLTGCGVIDSMSADMHHHTVIEGKNGIGKTTIVNAIVDVLTGNMMDGTSADGKLKPKGSDGYDIPRMVVERGFVADVNGEEHSFSKKTSEKRVIKRGTTEEVFQGNITQYFIDGFDKKQADFNDYVEEELAAKSVLEMCMIPAKFISKMQKSTTDARVTLEEVSGFDVQQFVDEHPEFKDSYSETKGNSIEAAIKKAQKELRAQVKVREEAKTKLQYETERVISDDTSAFDKTVKELTSELEAIDAQLKEIKAEYDKKHELQRKVVELECDIANIEKTASKDLLKKRRELMKMLDSLKTRQMEITSKNLAVSTAKDMLKKEIETKTVEVKNLAAKLKEVQASQFDTRKETCPTCGRKLEAETIQSLINKFNENKKRVIDDINTRGSALTKEIKEMKARYSSLAVVDVTDINASISRTEKSLSEIPETEDVSKNSDVIRIRGLISNLERQIADINALRSKEADLSTRADSIRSSIRYNQTQIDVITAQVKDREDRLVKLEETFREEAQRCADLECKIDSLKAFAFAKNQALSDMVNQYFSFIKFQFIDKTIDGNVYETLKITVDGIDYNTCLNESSKKLAEVDLCCGLQKMNDLCLPIFLDEASIIDPNRIPWDIDQQLIILRRSDNDKLTITAA